MKRWRQKGLDRREWTSVVQEVKVLRGRVK